jgi:ElaB/YqjD/DUF883 family membrane-anchored ribosome-binding protein
MDKTVNGITSQRSMTFKDSIMNFDHQSLSGPDGLHQDKVSHRPLNEKVLQSAVEAAKDEVSVVKVSKKDLSAGHEYEKSHRLTFTNRMYQRLEDRATRFVLLRPMRASMIAASAGALLALFLEHSAKRLLSRWR